MPVWDERSRTALLRTLAWNGTAATLALGLGIVPAMWIASAGVRGRWIAVSMCAVPLLVPSVLMGYAWRETLADIGILARPGSILDALRCAMTLGLWLWPVPALVVGLWMRSLGQSLVWQMRLDGAVVRVGARLMVTPMLLGWCGAFVLAVQEFSVYETTGVMVSSVLVRETLDDFTRSQPERLARAAWVSMPLVLMCVVIALASAWMARRGRVDVGDDEPRAGWRMRGWMRYAAIVLSIGTSLGTLVLLARQHSGELSIIDAWRAFGPHVVASAWHTLMAAGLSALLLAAGLLVRGGWVVLASIGAFLVGGQWIALVWIRMLNSVDGWLFEWIYDSPGAWVMAMLSRFGWIVMAVSMVSWREGGMRLREMARVDGASRAETVVWVIGPMTAGAAAAGLLIFAALSMTEVPSTVLLQPSGSLVPLMMGWVHIQRYDPLIEVGMVLGALVLMLGLMSGWLLRRVGK